jgi:septal ring factor EnvC (AmiA/AmiB activator)
VAGSDNGRRHGWIIATAAALLPVMVGALVTVAWQNSHRLVELKDNQEVIRRDLDDVREEVEPKSTLLLRFEADEREIADLKHQLRELQSDVNQALRAPLPGPKRR